MVVHFHAPPSLFDEVFKTVRKPPSNNPYEYVLQDADMPRCPLCRQPVMLDDDKAVFEAHGMAGLIHQRCQLPAVRVVD